MQRLVLLSLVALIGFRGGVDADCTDAEDQAITDAYAAAAATSACSSYATVNTWVFISPPCSATDCLVVVQDLANSIPNCTTGASTSEKDQLLRSLDICATPAPTPASTASTTNCTNAEAEATFNAFYEAANGSCASSTTIEAYEIIIDTQCNSTCAAAVQEFAQSLPNCNYEQSYVNTNKKQDIATQFGLCETLDDATNISIYIDSVENLWVPNCTTEEIEETVAFFKTITTNESCIDDSSVCAYDIHVNADCSSPCGRLIRNLRIDVPECYFANINHKEGVLDGSYQCGWIVDPDNVTLYFHYSETLNATGNSTCDPDFDSTVTSVDNSRGADSATGDSSAAKLHQNLVFWAIASVATACAVVLHV